MAYQSRRPIYTSPAAQRRRAQAQRRSMCCCSLMLLVSLIIAVVAFRGVLGRIFHRAGDSSAAAVTFPLSLETNRTWYYRYHLVPVAVSALNADGTPQSKEEPEVVIRRDGKRVPLLGHFKQLQLHYDPATQTWRGNWPPRWNCPPGTYTIEAKMAIDPGEWNWEPPDAKKRKRSGDEAAPSPQGNAWAVATTQVEIRARQRADMPPGFCVATWEYDFRETFVGPDGSRGDWRKLFDWVEYVGADAFWFRGAVTEGGGLSIQQPFKRVNLDAIPKLGAEAHRRGLKFGAWAVAYSTYPRSNRGKPDYDFAVDISRSTGQTSHHNFISLLDNRRVEALTEFFRKMQATDEVDMVGLDYLRSDRGGYE
ncbi:MAG: hypothetical protein J7M38_08670, partial [Armatimonadetes bacterium]|nr:hypothetical protein [Armatimonadota bacterium]